MMRIIALRLLLISVAAPFSTGAGQDVGRSCLLLRINGKNVMLDCGMREFLNIDLRIVIH